MRAHACPAPCPSLPLLLRRSIAAPPRANGAGAANPPRLPAPCPLQGRQAGRGAGSGVHTPYPYEPLELLGMPRPLACGSAAIQVAPPAAWRPES
jgi:hypothetical protein